MGEREKSDGILQVAGDGGLGVTDPVAGPVFNACATASFPSAASATTCQFGCSLRSARRPDLTTAWSSAMRMVVIKRRV